MTAPDFCILRAEKLTTFGSIIGSAKHTFREIPTPNADPNRTHLNKTWGAQTAAAVCEAIKARLPAKRRKDAVLCIEYLITASPEWLKSAPKQQQNSYFRAAVQWLHARHGKDNVVCVNMQLDETSPHLVAYVVPRTLDGRLAAKDFLGGRKVLSEMQSDFWEKAGKPVGLTRGVEGSKATHTTAKQYAAAMQINPALVPPSPLPAPSIADRLSGQAKQAQEKYKRDQEEYAAQLEQARSIVELGQKARLEQAEAIERLRQEAEEAKQHQVEAARLREENARLVRELARERSRFEKKIDELKGALRKAIDAIKSLLRRAEKAEAHAAHAEAHAEHVEANLTELRAILFPGSGEPAGPGPR